MRKAVAVPVAVGAGLIFAAPRMFKRAWRPPQRDVDRSPSDLGLPEEQVWLTNDRGLKLHAWLVPAEGVAPAVVVLHGWGGNAALMLELGPSIRDAGIHILFLDARNHGLSEHDDHVSMLRFADDLATAVDYLSGRDDVTEVAVIGHSVGAAASIYYGSHNDNISSVIAVSSFAHPGDIMDANLSFSKPVRWLILRAIEVMIGRSLDEIAPRARIGQVEVPLMLIHGDRDDVVPVENSVELAGLREGTELLIVPDGKHSDLTPYEPYFPDVVGFLWRSFDRKDEPITG